MNHNPMFLLLCIFVYAPLIRSLSGPTSLGMNKEPEHYDITYDTDTGDELDPHDEPPLNTGVNKTGVCDPRVYYEQVQGRADAYWQCTPKSELWDGVGEWEIKNCPKGTKFLKRAQKCENSTNLRRHPGCTGGFPCGLGPTCNAPYKPRMGGACDWLNSRLELDPFSNSYFMQCVVPSPGINCGAWVRSPCAPGTLFNMQAQVCVTSALQGTCTHQFQAVCPCGPNNLCPSMCTCQHGTCCMPPRLPTVFYPTCPDGRASFGLCLSQSQCGVGHVCINGGCCPDIPPVPPIPVPIPVPPPPPIIPPQPLYPPLPPVVHGPPPVPPYPPFLPPPPPIPAVPTRCPDAQPPTAPCDAAGHCPPSQFCFHGSCCVLSRCPNGDYPVRACGTQPPCPSNTQCINGGCCPLPLPVCPAGLMASRACHVMDPNSCDLGTTGQFCFVDPRGYQGCCPMPRCPAGVPAIGPCLTGTPCPPGTVCLNGACCPAPRSCPNGAAGVQPCAGIATNECPAGFTCIGTTCCPMLCADGVAPIQSCSRSGTCPAGSVCRHGMCCPHSMCPNGIAPTQTCAGVGLSGCPSGHGCHQGSCCRIAICPSGEPSVQSCLGSGQINCPLGYVCMNEMCCRGPPIGGPPYPIPVPGAGIPPRIPLPGGPIPFGAPPPPYLRGGPRHPFIHPVPIPHVHQACPDGVPALKPCPTAVSCPIGFQCAFGGCCRVPPPLLRPRFPIGVPRPILPSPLAPLPRPMRPFATPWRPFVPFVQHGLPYAPLDTAGRPVRATSCPNGADPAGPCAGDANCPHPGTVCIEGFCCPQFRSVCPSGHQAAQPCAVDSFDKDPCQPGFKCRNGGCCPLVMSAKAAGLACTNPAHQPICYCASYNNACPPSTSCQQGLCCAPETSPLFDTVRPGDRCTSTSQCPGPFSSCVNGYCICTGNSRSNGVQCVPYALQATKLKKYKPGEDCGQFATDCKAYDVKDTDRLKRLSSHTPRLAMEELGIREDEEPVFWYTNAEPHCRTDSDCTPDMTCIQGKCFAYMSIGERGCVSSLQCGRTALGSECEYENALNATLCRCMPDLIWHDRKCVKACPMGTRLSDKQCVTTISRSEEKESKSKTLSEFTSRIANLFGTAGNGETNPEVVFTSK